MNKTTFEIPCDGYAIKADWYENDDNHDEILLVIPGYTSTRARQVEMTTAIIKETGTSALVIEFTGHGESPFNLVNTRPGQHFLELIHVFEWLKNKYPSAKISILGSSYGGFMATQLTKYREFDKLVLKVPAIYKPEAFYDLWSIRENNVEEYRVMMEAYRTDVEALAKHPLLARAANFKGNTLVVVHDNDEMVPKPTTDAFIKAFNAESFVEENFPHAVPAASVETGVSEEKLQAYYSRIASWLKSN